MKCGAANIAGMNRSLISEQQFPHSEIAGDPWAKSKSSG